MLIVVDPHSGIPVFRQIMDQIRFHVVSGLLQPGDELPSTRTLSASIGINPMTVSKAFHLLEKEGIVDRRPGLPLVVREQPSTEIHKKRIEQLRTRLGPIATMIRQLHIDSGDALELLRELLEESDEDER